MRCLAGLLLLHMTLGPAGCSSEAPPAAPLPPQSARPLADSGGYETRLDLVVSDLRHRLANHGIRDTTVEAFAVPAPMTWPAITHHYARALGDAWRPAADIPPSGFVYRLQVWRGPGGIFAAALIEEPEAGRDVPFKILLQVRASHRG